MLIELIVTGHSSDVSWNIFDLFVWAQLELQLGIMCAAAPSLRVFFRRYLGGSFASRAYKSTRGETPAPGTSTFGTESVSKPDKSITVVRSTSVTFNEDQGANKPQFESSLDTVGESEIEQRNNWSPTPSKECLTRYSHEDDIPMNDMSWKHPDQSRQSRWV